jgi:hypothetical protein
MSSNIYPNPNSVFTPTEVLNDPVNKLRTSSPQALIDTDFEYGTQISKWENLAATNNRPFAAPSATTLSNISSMTMSSNARVVTVSLSTTSSTPNSVASATPVTGFATYTTAASHGFFPGQYVTIAGSSVSGYNGTFLITSTPTATTFVVANSTTGTPSWSGASALAGVAPAVGSAITVQDTYLNIANGNFLIETGGGTGTFTYLGRAQNTLGVTSIFDPNKTSIAVATIYTNAQIGGAPTVTVSGTDLKVTVTTTVPHGLSVGNEIGVTGITGTNPPNGSYQVATVASPTTFVYYADPTEGTPSSLTASSAAIYVRPQAQFLHRPFDGGVLFSANGSSNYETAIRQTRRYFRYQSGKGIQMSSGTIFKPYGNIDSITSSGGVATVTTKEQHNIQPGTTIVISGANESAYNGSFTVSSITGYNSFTYAITGSPASPATGIVNVNVNTWYGAANRLGIFDSQNGLFWEFDGQNLYAVKRSSTQQLSGRVDVTNGSNVVSRTTSAFPTAFSSQLNPGDYVVIRGQSYRVLAIDDISSTPNFTISPSYRGASTSHVTVSKTIETRIPQSQFNLDKLDGTGPSGYTIDLTKMQMFYVDYSWYGAGFIRWGVRATNGDVIYAHKMQNNNVNNEAYMRSGNLPGRYESQTLPPTTKVTANIGASDTTLTVSDTSSFPTTGTLLIRPSTATNQASLTYEYVNYTGKTATTFTGLTRSQAGAAGVTTTWTAGSNSGTVSSATGIQIGQRVVSSTSPNPVPDGTFVTGISGTTVTLNSALTANNPTLIFAPLGATSGTAYTYSAASPISVELAAPTFSPSVSHWGTSVIMDGRFDDDKSLIFTYGQTNFATIASGASKALMSIRVAPSVDNGIGAAFGARDLINRMQLKMSALDITTKTTGANLLIRAYLNGVPSSATAWTNAVGNIPGVVNSSLAQIADHGTGVTTVYGGEVTGGFFVSTTGSIDLGSLRDLGNSILGGGSTVANTGIYPDGPDTLTFVVTNVGTTSADVLGRISWTEAQA